MAAQLESSRWGAAGPAPLLGHGPSAGARGWERLVQAALAIYLVPALAIVLVVGGLGLLVLAVARVVAWAVSGPGRAAIADSPVISGAEK